MSTTTKTKRKQTTEELLAIERANYRRPEIEGQDVPEDAPEPTQPNLGRSVVYSLRLAPEEVAVIERLADERDLPASVIVRGFIRQGLAEFGEQNNLTAILARMHRDMDALRAAVGMEKPKASPRGRTAKKTSASGGAKVAARSARKYTTRAAAVTPKKVAAAPAKRTKKAG